MAIDFVARRFAVLGVALSISVAFAGVAGAQFLKSGETAPAPEFRGVTEWINSDPLTMAKLRGKVVLVHFWTNGCYNCKNNYPHYKAWQGRYKDNIGANAPKFTLKDQKGEERSLDEFVKRGKVALVFYRSADW
jgi:thiol-disulfide isomerase/thioredoxin